MEARYFGKCKQCGKEVGAYYKSKVPTFCSYECSNQWKWDNIRQRKEFNEYSCPYCGKKVLIDKTDRRIKDGQTMFYCCVDCANKYKWINKEEKTCPICGKKYCKYNAKTCSKECGYELKKLDAYKKKRNLPNLSYDEYTKMVEEDIKREEERRRRSIKVVCSNGYVRYYEQDSFLCSGREKAYMKEYHATHRKERARKHLERTKKDPLYGFKVKVRKFICQSFKRRKESKVMRTEEILGCSFERFMAHICSLFKDGMTIDNYGEWQIDHIIPLSTARNKEDVIRLCHYTNLQPLWASENRAKSNKII